MSPPAELVPQPWITPLLFPGTPPAKAAPCCPLCPQTAPSSHSQVPGGARPLPGLPQPSHPTWLNRGEPTSNPAPLHPTSPHPSLTPPSKLFCLGEAWVLLPVVLGTLGSRGRGSQGSWLDPQLQEPQRAGSFGVRTGRLWMLHGAPPSPDTPGHGCQQNPRLAARGAAGCPRPAPALFTHLPHTGAPNPGCAPALQPARRTGRRGRWVLLRPRWKKTGEKNSTIAGRYFPPEAAERAAVGMNSSSYVRAERGGRK